MPILFDHGAVTPSPDQPKTGCPDREPSGDEVTRLEQPGRIEDLARLGTFEVDFETTVLKWSDGTYRIFGLNPGTPICMEQALGLFDPGTRREVVSRLERARAFGQPYDITIPFHPKQGGTRWARVIAHVSRDKGRSKLIGAVQDITRDYFRDRELRAEIPKAPPPDLDDAAVCEVEKGLAEGQFEAFHQPIVDLRTRIVRGWEALIRWNHPQRGFLLPSQFSGALVHPRTSAAIDDFMLATSLAQMRRWLDAGVPVTCAGVNISDAQLRRPGFADHVLAQIDAHGLTPDRLKIEVLETAFLGAETGAVASTIERLASHGVVSAFDDFGTGYASLTHLKQFRVERIKVDRSFIANLEHSTFDRAIVRCLANLGRDLGIRITAEGIETVEQLRILRAMGCDCGQGYLFSPPLPAHEVPSFLGKWRDGTAARILGDTVPADAPRESGQACWADWDAAVLVSCFGANAKAVVAQFAEAEQLGALSDMFPERHFQHMLRRIDDVAQGDAVSSPRRATPGSPGNAASYAIEDRARSPSPR